MSSVQTNLTSLSQTTESVKIFDRSLSKMILESVSTNNNEKAYLLRGMCADFNGVNENGRYYTEDNYLPLVEKLQEKIAKNKLVGETEHPEEDYSLSFKKELSHVIKKLWYDKIKRQVWIEIEILPTTSGKNIMVYIDKKIPVYISSRGEGYISEDGKVILDNLITYDIVYEPGFKDAKLEIISEHLTNKNKIYICRDKIMENNKQKTPIESLEEKYSNQIQELKSQISEMKNTSIKHAKIISDIKSVTNSTSKKLQKLAPFNKKMKIAESLEQVELFKNSDGQEISFFEDKLNSNDVFSVDGVNYLVKEVADFKEGEIETDQPLLYKYITNDGETDHTFYSDTKGNLYKLDNTVEEKPEVADQGANFPVDNTATDGITEALNKSDVLAKLFSHIERITESHNDTVDEINAQSTKLQGVIDYCKATDDTIDRMANTVDSLSGLFNHLVDHIENNVTSFVNDLADKSDEIVTFVNDLADKNDETVDFVNDLADKSDETVEFANSLADDNEDVSDYLDNQANEISERLSKGTFSKGITESKNTDNKKIDDSKKESLLSITKKFSEKVSNLNESVKKQKIDRQEIELSTKYKSYDSMGDDLQTRFKQLSDLQKAKVDESLNSLKFVTPQKIEEIFVGAKNSFKNLKFLNGLSSSHLKIWESLNTSSKNDIVSLISLRDIKSGIEVEAILEQYDSQRNSHISESKDGSPIISDQSFDENTLGYSEEDVKRYMSI